MNALVTVEQAPTAGPHGEGHTLFSPRRQGEFLQNLQLFGNVRLACRAARVSAQTAYRQRRASPALRQAWDAALLAARDHAEQVLAERALEGWEEAVFYHGEEVARRRRYSDRLLLAHLARLDRLEERGEVAEALTRLDAVIDGLREGEAIETCFPAQAGTSVGSTGRPEAPACAGDHELPQDRVPSVPSCRDCGGQCDDPRADLGPEDCQWLGNRLARREATRPLHALSPAKQCDGSAEERDMIDAWQLEAFEAGVEEWWLVTSEEELVDAAAAAYERDTRS
ncbi:hypothetical protein [Qipengyuania vesicularis]|uniref:hypothetical protein n=1 Tax=Qipengyuania vesicularis TaxID=2867232 RepID=UPI001C86B91D|nr:hypothetical protein [Qipengyuania vesicularis]MBX7526630.1 hypothetical protein [Qipengyuania vesicularis]